MNKIDVLKILKENIKNKNIVKYVFSDTKNYEYTKIILRVINIKNKRKIQIESFKENKAFHSNFDFEDEKIFILLENYLKNFKQVLAQTAGIDFIFNKKAEFFSKK